MHGYDDTHRRMVLLAYHRFLMADRSFQEAQSDAFTWFPGSASRKKMLMGDPGSRVRGLFERRNRALARLRLVRQALRDERKRSQKRHRPGVILLEAR